MINFIQISDNDGDGLVDEDCHTPSVSSDILYALVGLVLI